MGDGGRSFALEPVAEGAASRGSPMATPGRVNALARVPSVGRIGRMGRGSEAGPSISAAKIRGRSATLIGQMLGT